MADYYKAAELNDELLVVSEFQQSGDATEAELDEAYAKTMDAVEKLEFKNMMRDEEDSFDAILNINSGAGGTESCDWAGMLYRMYGKWADSKGFTMEVLDFLDGDEAGIKSVTVQINGYNAFGLLKSEKGVHRLVRISPFNAAGKRQTSFVSCDVMPDIEEDLDVEINPFPLPNKHPDA